MNVCEFLPVEAAQRANQHDATGSSESSPGRVAEDAGVSDPPLTWESRRVCVCVTAAALLVLDPIELFRVHMFYT